MHLPIYCAIDTRLVFPPCYDSAITPSKLGHAPEKLTSIFWDLFERDAISCPKPVDITRSKRTHGLSLANLESTKMRGSQKKEVDHEGGFRGMNKRLQQLQWTTSSFSFFIFFTIHHIGHFSAVHLCFSFAGEPNLRASPIITLEPLRSLSGFSIRVLATTAQPVYFL